MHRIIFKFYLMLAAAAIVLFSSDIFAQIENRFELNTGYYHAVDFAGGMQARFSHQVKILSKDIYTFISVSYGRLKKEHEFGNYELHVFSGRWKRETIHNYVYETLNVFEVSSGLKLGKKIYFIPEILRMKIGTFSTSGWGYIFGVEYPVSEKIGINMSVIYKIIHKPFYPEISRYKIKEFCGIGLGLAFIKN